MNKQNYLHRWLWRWHMIAGLFTLPIIILLAITGVIYLFKNDYNQYVYHDTLNVEIEGNPLSYQEQLKAVQSYTDTQVASVVLPSQAEQATAFILQGKGHAKTAVYINPYTAKVTGEIDQKQTTMHLIRKLHGELLLSKPGTYFVELVASWFIVLLITGVYIFWPKQKGWQQFFRIRISQGRAKFYRDCHTVLGFWLAIFMTIIIAGGMPWTDFFGNNLKWVQQQTHTGYPEHWRNSKGLSSTPNERPLSVDNMVEKARSLNLSGTITLTLPQTANQVFTVSNRALLLRDQAVVHFDQYTGHQIKHLEWQDVGVLMDVRQVFMRLHQGQYGAVTWWSVLIITLLFTFSSIAGLVAYLYRKPTGSLGLVKVPARFKISASVFALIIVLAVVFPLFGLSLCLIAVFTMLKASLSRAPLAQ